MTIQRMGKNPKAAPSAALSSDWPTGMPNAATATTRATASDTRPAIHALTRRTPSRTNSVTSGIAAHRADSPRDPPTGSSTCLNTSALLAAEGLWAGAAGAPGSGGDQGAGRKAADGGVEHLDRVRHADPGALPLQRGPHPHAAAGGAGDQQGGAGRGDVAGLAITQLAGRLGEEDVPDARR